MRIKIIVISVISIINLCLYGQARAAHEISSKDFHQDNLTKDNSKLLFDSLNCRFVGNWPFGPAYAVAYDSARNLVFFRFWWWSLYS
jgi:hypothetical protein